MRIGALDVGSNSVLMLVADLNLKAGTIRCVDDFVKITRLGRGVDKNGRLDADSARLTLDTITELAGKARELGAERVVSAATSALRDAKDGGKFIAKVKERSGIALDIITGRAEAELSHLAVRRSLKIDPEAKLLIVDIGGGSTEFIRSEPGQSLTVESLQIGSVRLTERLIHHDPPSTEDIRQLRDTIDEAIRGLKWEFRPTELVGIAGTVTTICAVALGLGEYEAARVHGHRLNRDEVARTLEKFASVTTAERKKIPGVVEGRADVIVAGTTILDRVMVLFGAQNVIVSDQGVRWGLAWRELERMSKPGDG